MGHHGFEANPASSSKPSKTKKDKKSGKASFRRGSRASTSGVAPEEDTSVAAPEENTGMVAAPVEMEEGASIADPHESAEPLVGFSKDRVFEKKDYSILFALMFSMLKAVLVFPTDNL